MVEIRAAIDGPDNWVVTFNLERRTIRVEGGDMPPATYAMLPGTPMPGDVFYWTLLHHSQKEHNP